MQKAIVICYSLLLSIPLFSQDPGACGTLIEDLKSASIEQLGQEYQRLKSYNNPYCDTTNSDYHKIMAELANKLVAGKADKEAIIAEFGAPYFQGTIEEYEGQKVQVGRDGKMIGTMLPPQFKIPAGDYYLVYLWRKKDYLTFALKGGKASGSSWWEKGKY